MSLSVLIANCTQTCRSERISYNTTIHWTHSHTWTHSAGQIEINLFLWR